MPRQSSIPTSFRDSQTQTGKMSCRLSCAKYTVLLFSFAFLGIFILRLQLGLPDFQMPPRAKYPPGVPDKFDPDGNVQHFAGNTIHCQLSDTSELYASLHVLYDRLKQSRLSHLYALLPPSSWHMTVFKGVVDQIREPWPDNLATTASLEECNALFKKELSSFDLDTKLPYHLTVVGFTSEGMGLHVVPHNAAELRGLRDRLADLLRIRYSDHEDFELHISLGYFLRYLTDDQIVELNSLKMDHFKDMPKEFELGAPEFARFEDMFAYEPLLHLKNRDS
jgi:hypothetical protein